MPAVAVARPLIPLARSLLGRLSPRFGRRTIPIGRFTNNHLARRYRGYSPLAGPGYTPSRHNWSRISLPLYGVNDMRMPVDWLELPDGITFLMEGDLPEFLPRISWATPRYRYEIQPDLELQIAAPPPRGYQSGGTTFPPGPRAEPYRRRRDTKVPGWYMASLSFINRTYGELTEYGDLLSAIKYGSDPLQVTANLAMNHAIDYAYGARARALKKHLYRKPYYNLPVGIDTLSRLWR